MQPIKTMLAVSSVLFLCVFSQIVKAQVLVATDLSAIGANDQVNWSQFGDGYGANSPLSFVSNGSLNGNANASGDNGGALFVLQQGTDWSGNFANGDNILWTGTGVNTLQISLNSPVSGIGTYLDSDYYGSQFYTAQIQAYDSSNNLLGTFTNSGAADSPAFFLGVTSSTPDISSVTYTTTAGPNAGDFAIDTIYLNNPNINPPPSAVPEPGVLMFLLCALLFGMFILMYKRTITKRWKGIAVSLIGLSLFVRPIPSMASVTAMQLHLHSTLAISGHLVNAYVSLSSPAPNGGAMVSLSSDKQNVANLPPSVTIPSGQTNSETFNIVTSFVNLPTSVSFTASYDGNSSVSTLNVYPAPRIGGGGNGFAGLQPYSPWPETGCNNQRNGEGVGIGATGAGIWSVYVHGTVHSSPAIARDGTVYFDADGLWALNSNGTTKWWFNQNGWNTGSSSPAIGSDGTIYICMGASLYAVDPDSALKWKYKTNDQNYAISNSSPIIGANGTIYFGGVDYYNFGGHNDFYAVSQTGNLVWKDEFDTGGSTQSTPAIGPNGIIYVPQEFGLIAINPQSGAVLWQIHYLDTYVASTVSVGSDGTVYMDTTPGGDFGNTFQNMNNVLFALNPNTGGIKWSFATDVSPGAYDNSAPAIGADGTIYENVPGGWLYAINPANGSQKWALNLSSTQISSTPPAIGGDGTIYVGDVDYYLYAVNANGVLDWTYNTGGNVFSSPAIGADGTIYIGGGNENLLAIK